MMLARDGEDGEDGEGGEDGENTKVGEYNNKIEIIKHIYI